MTTAKRGAFAPFIISQVGPKRFDVLRKTVENGGPMYVPYITAHTRSAAEQVADLLTNKEG